MSAYQQIKDHLRTLYLDDPHPRLVGFSGGTPFCHSEHVETVANRLSFDVRSQSYPFGARHSSLDNSPSCTVVERDKTGEGPGQSKGLGNN